MRYLCTTCSEVWEEEELTEGDNGYMCPAGASHTIYHIEEVCDIVNDVVKDRDVDYEAILEWNEG